MCDSPVSACLGIHVPFPVSTELLERANISLNPTKSQSNNIYNQLLTIRWASDYDDIVEDLKADGQENLIKNPHKPKSKAKKLYNNGMQMTGDNSYELSPVYFFALFQLAAP